MGAKRKLTLQKIRVMTVSESWDYLWKSKLFKDAIKAYLKFEVNMNNRKPSKTEAKAILKKRWQKKAIGSFPNFHVITKGPAAGLVQIEEYAEITRHEPNRKEKENNTITIPQELPNQPGNYPKASYHIEIQNGHPVVISKIGRWTKPIIHLAEAYDDIEEIRHKQTAYPNHSLKLIPNEILNKLNKLKNDYLSLFADGPGHVSQNDEINHVLDILMDAYEYDADTILEYMGIIQDKREKEK